ncbi:hypothetical protein CU097_007252 [Rhizopus azygosporus]|uniref:Uncharacterized protein n=1 Tax=Rhizopus azygosporus TaxID=86630 RepID=A0A367JKY9_RHIAZ|nr:hypothetical protein CU097_007252 [Rhizopus azygosporus]
MEKHPCDNTNIKVWASNGRHSSPKSFVKSISPGRNECCHYSNKDCTPRGVDYDEMTFDVMFWWPRYASGRFSLLCVAGGGLAFYGTETNHWAECTQLDGQTRRIDFN